MFKDATQPFLALVHRALGAPPLPTLTGAFDAAEQLLGLHRFDEIVVAVLPQCADRAINGRVPGENNNLDTL